MYIMEINEVSGGEPWYDGPGWYYTDEVFAFHGPFETELLAIEEFAWRLNAMFDRLAELADAMQSPGILMPDKEIIQ